MTPSYDEISKTDVPLTKKTEKESLQGSSGNASNRLGDTYAYEVIFPSYAAEKRITKEVEGFPREDQKRIAEALEALQSNPLPKTTRLKVLQMPVEIFKCLARYRLKVGDYRILYDIDHEFKHVVILGIRRRTERTYRI